VLLHELEREAAVRPPATAFFAAWRLRSVVEVARSGWQLDAAAVRAAMAKALLREHSEIHSSTRVTAVATRGCLASLTEHCLHAVPPSETRAAVVVGAVRMEHRQRSHLSMPDAQAHQQKQRAAE
jgi:hypothetical protein